MKNSNMKQLLLTAAVLALPMGLWSQVATVPMGGHASGAGGEMTVSLGQCATRTVYDTAVTVSARTASLTEGVLQAYLSFELTRIDGVEPLACSLRLFPNPTAQNFTIEADVLDTPLRYTLYTSSGQRLREGQFRQQVTLDVDDLPAGHYLLRVDDAEKNHSNVYKVIKIR